MVSAEKGSLLVLNEHEFQVIRNFLGKHAPPLTDEQWIFVGSSELRSVILAFVLHQKHSKDGILSGSLEEVLEEAFGNLSSALRAIMFGELTKTGLAHEFWFKGEVIAWVTPTPQMTLELRMIGVVPALDGYMQRLQDKANKMSDEPKTVKSVMQLAKKHGISEGKPVVDYYQDIFDPLF
ncbi:MAG TPA: hypothetical protein VFZ58_04195 [Candidatus Saccharimonadales bacterium]